MNSLIRPVKLVAAQAAIDAATEQFLQSGGTITRLDNKGSPVEHLSWKEEAARTKAAGLSYVSEQGHLVLRERSTRAAPPRRKKDPGIARANRQQSMLRANKARSQKNAAHRAALVPQVRSYAAKRWTTGQIARQLEVAPGTISRIGREHGIKLNKCRGAKPVEGEA